MVPDCRDFDKDSKKYLFAILGFFYEFLLILQIHYKHLKTNLNIMLKPLCFAEGALKRIGARIQALGRFKTEECGRGHRRPVYGEGARRRRGPGG